MTAPQQTTEGSPHWCAILTPGGNDGSTEHRWAEWLRQEIRAYVIPPQLVGGLNLRGEKIPARIEAVFVEETNRSGGGLTAEDLPTLAASLNLLVVCSPAATRSRLTDESIRKFKQLGKSGRILAAIVEGIPHAPAGSEAECFPQALKFAVDAHGQTTDAPAEPIAADFTAGKGEPGWTDLTAFDAHLRRRGMPAAEIAQRESSYRLRRELMKLKVIAGVLGIGLGELTERDKAYQQEQAKLRARATRLKATAIGAAALVALAAGAYAWHQYEEAKSARAEAIRQSALAETARKNAEVARKQAEAARPSMLLERARLLRKGSAGTPRDLPQAAACLREAADLGHVEAMFELANMIIAEEATGEAGKGAFEWMSRAASAGYTPAIGGLGEIYLAGVHVSQDRNKGRKLMLQAAELGDTTAQARYGTTSTNAEVGLFWLNKAAEAGNTAALNRLALIYNFGPGIMPGVQVDMAKHIDYLKKSAELRDPWAMTILSSKYIQGQGMPIDLDLGAWLYREALDLRHPQTLAESGVKYWYGDKKTGTDKNIDSAIRMFREASERNTIWAMYNLGLIYAQGDGVPPDSVEAVKWYRKVADNGASGQSPQRLSSSRNAIGDLCGDPELPAYDYVEAIKRYSDNAKLGDAVAQRKLGERLVNPRKPTEKYDAQAGLEWTIKAAAQGDGLAQVNLASWYGLGDKPGIAKDAIQAAAWKNQALASKDPETRRALAKLK